MEKGSKKRKKIPFEDVGVEVWKPTMDGQPWLSMFNGLPMAFKAPTYAAVIDMANQWRKEEMDKESRQEANHAAATERLKKYREDKVNGR